MKLSKVRNAVAEAERFLERAKEVETEVIYPDYPDYRGGTKRTASLKRASMDLSRALTELRRV